MRLLCIAASNGVVVYNTWNCSVRQVCLPAAAAATAILLSGLDGGVVVGRGDFCDVPGLSAQPCQRLPSTPRVVSAQVRPELLFRTLPPACIAFRGQRSKRRRRGCWRRLRRRQVELAMWTSKCSFSSFFVKISTR
jgi:hypothetical protein